MSEQARFEAWWDESGFNSLILRAAAWEAWMARAEIDKEPQPAEDPDEWVIQDMVPPRFGLDQWKWVGHDEPTNDVAWKSENGNFTRYMHGFEAHGETLHVRCRRRDLPKIEQAEQWPKYWTTDGSEESIAFIRQKEVNVAEFVYVDANRKPCEWPRGWTADDQKKRKQLTEAEAMSLIKKPEPRNRDEALAILVDEGQKLGMYTPQPAKTRVRLWMDEHDNCIAVSARVELKGGWKEIHHDAEGFYVEESK